MPTNTYVALRTTTVAVATPSVTFDLTGITGYTDLVLVASFTSTTGNNYPEIQLNGDTGSNYSRTVMYGNGSTATSTRVPNETQASLSAITFGTTSNAVITTTHIMNYSNSTTNKTLLTRSNNASQGTEATVNLWRNTAAVTSITYKSANNFAVGSTFTIYGIASEVSIAPTTTPPVSGYSLWLDSADPASFTYSSGTLVSQWSDKSGNGFHFTQGTTGYQPNRISTIRQNNYPVVTFAGDFVANASLNWGASNSTVFLVAKEDKTAGTGYQNLFTTGTGASGQWGYGIADNPGGDKIGIFDILQGFTGFNSVASTANADIMAFLSAGISSGSVTSNLFLNGTADSLNPRTQTSTTSAAGALLGAANTANEPFYGYICEVLLYPSQLSSTDRGSVETYLKSKWGIA